MNKTVLLFSSAMGRAEYRVRQILGELGQGVVGYRSIKRFSRRFDRPRGEIRMMVFLIPDHDVLNQLISLREKFYDLPVVLVLPDTNRDTLLKGHKFYPRYITFTGGDFWDLAVTLQNIFHRFQGLSGNQGHCRPPVQDKD